MYCEVATSRVPDPWTVTAERKSPAVCENAFQTFIVSRKMTRGHNT